MKIEVLGTKTCRYCRQARIFLNERGIEYTYKDITEDWEGRSRVLRAWEVEGEWASVPGIWIDEKFVGGFEDLRSHILKMEDEA